MITNTGAAWLKEPHGLCILQTFMSRSGFIIRSLIAELIKKVINFELLHYDDQETGGAIMKHFELNTRYLVQFGS